MDCPPKNMALITSDCGIMSSMEHRMAPITSGCCAAFRRLGKAPPLRPSSGTPSATHCAVRSTAIPLHPSLPLAGSSTGTERGRQQSDGTLGDRPAFVSITCSKAIRARLQLQQRSSTGSAALSHTYVDGSLYRRYRAASRRPRRPTARRAPAERRGGEPRPYSCRPYRDPPAAAVS